MPAVPTELTLHLEIPLTLFSEEKLDGAAIMRLKRYLKSVLNEGESPHRPRRCFNGEFFRFALDTLADGIKRHLGEEADAYFSSLPHPEDHHPDAIQVDFSDATTT